MRSAIVLLTTFMFFLVMPLSAQAHTVLEHSKPADGETVAEPLQQLELRFAEEIEPLSVLKMINASGEEIPVSDIAVDGNMMRGSLPSDIPNGEYTVNWKIAGKDGHLIEGSFAFTLGIAVDSEAPAIPENEPTEESATETPSTEESSEAAEQLPNPSEVNQEVAAGGSTNVRDFSGIFITGAIAVIAVIAYVFVRRANRNGRA